MARQITVALAGNPNSGKSTIFNNLTGFRQHVGNYPGVTVEKKEGFIEHKGYGIKVVDLPGTYSLTAHSLDEIIARNFIVEEKPDVVVDVVDASNLERNLYLAVQIMELGAPLVLAFNMADLASKQGLVIDKEKLSELIGVPIVLTVATKKIAMDDLLDSTLCLVEERCDLVRSRIHYGKEIDKQLARLTSMLEKESELTRRYPARWLALKLIEQDAEIKKLVEGSRGSEGILKAVERSVAYLRGIFGDDPEVIIAERRYGFISGACDEAVRKNYEVRHNTSDIIDMVLLNRLLGLPIFFVLIWLTFKFVFYFSKPIMGGIETVLGLIAGFVGGFLPDQSLIQSLVVDGVIGGVGSVLVFIPVIYLLYFALSFLEDSGYLARAAFLMDKFMHKIGLHGRSFIPMLLGFGCNLPAIMATRTIEDENDRLTTLLVIPFMSCGARLPIYVLFISAFFPAKHAGNILFLLYCLGILTAVVMAKLFRRYLLVGKAAPFVMELPPYRLPTLRALVIHMWEKGVLYLKKAGTIIFAGCVIMWFLSSFPWRVDYTRDYDNLIHEARSEKSRVERLERARALEKTERSYAGKLGKLLAPVLSPIGFDDWKLGVGLVGGFFAKEIVVATLGALYATEDVELGESPSLRRSLQNARHTDGTKVYTPLVAFTVMVFSLLYLPCIATVAVIRKETNSWRWPAFTILYTIGVAWIVSFVVYQGGRLIGLAG